jgi:hypothetical protein
MNGKISWARRLRTIVVAAVLLTALVGAVLASIGTKAPVWLWACDPVTRGAAMPHDPVRPAPG